ncbi:MAG: thermonuclease family protein, partial [Alphaproteobacteria bacterium]
MSSPGSVWFAKARMATRRAVSAGIAITALTAGATAQEGAPGTCIHEAGQAVAVAEVIDGDTLRLVEGTLVRLAGVTTPRGPMAADETLPLQETARRVLSALLATGAVT